MNILNEGAKNGFSATVTSMRAQAEGAEIAVSVALENGDGEKQTLTYVLLTEQYTSIKPVKGPISQSQLEALETASRLREAIRHGQRLLSYVPSSAKNLARKLRTKGYTHEEATAAADRLAVAGLIDERGDMEREVASGLHKLWGARRIRAHLQFKGFDPALIETLPDLLSEIDFAENCAELIRKRYRAPSSDPIERRKQYAALARYGYSPEEIREAFRLLAKDRKD